MQQIKREKCKGIFLYKNEILKTAAINLVAV